MPVLFLIVFVDLMGFGIIIPLAPYYAEHFGASPDTVTLLVATYSLMQFLGAPAWGAVSDRIGRKPVLMVSMIGAAASYFFAAFATELWMLFAARAFAGLMAGNIAAAQAFVADTTRPEDRSRGMGLIGAAFGLGFIFGPVIGGLLGGPSAAEADFMTPFLAGAGMSLLAAFLALVLLKESWTPEKRAKFGPVAPIARLRQLSAAFKKPVLGWLIAIFFVFTFAFAGMEATYALWAERTVAWGPRHVGLSFAFAGLVVAVVQGGLIGPLTRRFGERNLIAAGALVLALGFALVVLAQDALLAVLAMGVMAAGISLANPALSALISRFTPPDMQGGVLGVSQSASSIARVLGPSWAGLIFAQGGAVAPYVSGAAIMAVVFALSLVALRLPPRNT